MRRTLALVLLLCCWGANAFSYTLELTEAEIQARVDALMPLEKKRFFITAILRHPEIDLIGETNRIRLTADVELKAPRNVSGAGRVSFSASLRYDARTGSFHLDDLRVDGLEVAGVSESHIPRATRVLQFVARKYLAAKPVFTLKDNDVKQQLARSALKSVEVQGDVLTVELGLL